MLYRVGAINLSASSAKTNELGINIAYEIRVRLRLRSTLELAS